MFINIFSALTGVLMFPMWSTAKTLAVHMALVVCDWAGHYLHAGTVPSYILPTPGLPPHEQEVMTSGDLWMAVVMDFVWRVLMPAAANVLIMHSLKAKTR